MHTQSFNQGNWCQSPNFFEEFFDEIFDEFFDDFLNFFDDFLNFFDDFLISVVMHTQSFNWGNWCQSPTLAKGMDYISSRVR